jgi:8-oxo-dGTP pyrophosphatase MutT (NUDIX family)
VAERDGDGWGRCDQGHLHWGRFGAVGLLGYAGDEDDVRVLLARRSRWSQHGGSWGPPGGARDSDEDPVDAALREAAEECDLPPSGVRIGAMLLDDHGGWSYRTYVAAAAALFPVRAASPEISAARWVSAAEVASLPLHPGFARHWPVLSRALVQVTIIVDVANVMGARPDGWWRDRAGAALRLHAQLVSLAGRGIAALPGALELPRLDLWLPDFVLIVEGAAREAGFGRDDRVRVVAAPGSGDDAIVAQARDLPGRRLVVTADRELRRRCETAGASVTGPGWLLSLL